MKESVAIIGGGIAGLTAAYLLRERYDITLFEKDGRLGGNAYTFHSPDGDAIDTTVFAFSRVSYPNFFALLDELGIGTMSFTLRGIGATLYNIDTQEVDGFRPASLRGLLPANIRLTHLLRKSMQSAADLLDAGRVDGLSMREGLELIPELKGRPYLHLAFMLCLSSSMSFDELMETPATFFFSKVKAHFLSGPTVWRLVKGRTEAYVDALASHFRDRVLLNTEIHTVQRTERDVTITTENGEARRFDKLIFACPADTVLALLDEPTADEQRLLGAWKYKDGLVVVHRDDAHFPPPAMHNMYVYLYTDRDGRIETSINACYRCQRGVSNTSPYFGTQHPNFPIRDDLIAFQKVFRTPIFNPRSVTTTAELPSLNGHLNTYHCGSHFGHGLHEDAVTSAVNVAKALGVEWKAA